MSEPSMAIVLASPAELVKRNEEAIRAIRGTVEQHYTLRVGGRRYLMVAGAQAVATAMGYTTAIEAVRYVPAAEPLPGYWEATATVLLAGQVVGRGIGCVFDTEKPWNSRPHFARQAMAQTRATGRALKGVMGWATALMGAETSLAEEMPQEAPEMPQEPPQPVKRLPSRPKAAKPLEAAMAPREVRGICAAVTKRETTGGVAYWRVALEGEPGQADPEYTSLKHVPDMAGRMVMLRLEQVAGRGEMVAEVVDMEVDE